MAKKIYTSNEPYVVRSSGGIIAESKTVKILSEHGRDDRVFFPIADIAMVLLDQSETVAVDPVLGTAQYYDLAGKSGVIKDIAWGFGDATEFGDIRGHITFDIEKVALEKL